MVESKETIGPIDRFLADILINAARLERDDIYTDKNSIEYKEFPLKISEIKQIFLDKLQYVVKQNIGYNIHFDYYTLQVDFIAEDHQIILNYRANDIFKKHLNDNFYYFFTIDFLDFKGEPHGFPKKHQIYKPNDFLCQIFSNKADWLALKSNKTDRGLYKTFRNNGFDNYYKFLKPKEVENIIVGEDHVSKLKRIKALMKTFIDNNYQPLSREQFEKVK